MFRYTVEKLQGLVLRGICSKNTVEPGYNDIRFMRNPVYNVRYSVVSVD